MPKVIKADMLGVEIEKVLDKYTEVTKKNIKEIQRKVASKGASALKNESKAKFNGTGAYAKGWSHTTKKAGKHYDSTIIYNKDIPQLTHLLEHGHALVRGGRRIGQVQGRPHIAPVEEEVIRQYLDQVIAKL